MKHDRNGPRNAIVLIQTLSDEFYCQATALEIRLARERRKAVRREARRKGLTAG